MMRCAIYLSFLFLPSNLSVYEGALPMPNGDSLQYDVRTVPMYMYANKEFSKYMQNAWERLGQPNYLIIAESVVDRMPRP